MKDNSWKSHEKELDEISIKIGKSIKSLFSNISKACVKAAEEQENKFLYSRELADKWAKDIAESFGVTAQEAMDNMDNAIGGWEVLNIDNLPERFFTRDDIEFTRTETYCSGKIDAVKEQANIKVRLYYLDMISNGTIETIKYRYITQENKDSIRITKDIYTLLHKEAMIMNIGDMFLVDKTPIIIID